MTIKLSEQPTPALVRPVFVRDDGGSDRQVWADTFTGLYHLPPADMPEPRTVLDLGANIGLTAAHYHALWPNARIVAFEMDADNARMAQMNAPAVDVLTYAVTAAGGVTRYNPSVRAEAFAVGAEVGIDVQALTMREAIIRAFGSIPLVDFVKMDIEGAEWGIFATKDWVPMVRNLVVELHGEGGSEVLVEQAITMLTRIGFEARHHPPHPQAVFARR